MQHMPALTTTKGTMAFSAPTNGLGALESSLLFYFSLTQPSVGALSCPFERSLKMGALQNPISRPDICILTNPSFYDIL